MRVLRFDSVGGASGDMILGALVGLGVDPKLLEREIGKLIPEHFHLRVGEKTSFGASGVYLTVDIHELILMIVMIMLENTLIAKSVRVRTSVWDMFTVVRTLPYVLCSKRVP